MTYSGSTVAPKELTIGKEGAQFFESALSVSQLSELESVLAAQPRDHAGVRLSAIPELRPFLNQAGPVGSNSGFGTWSGMPPGARNTL
jgi:hypothetical protein